MLASLLQEWMGNSCVGNEVQPQGLWNLQEKQVLLPIYWFILIFLLLTKNLNFAINNTK